METSSHCSGMFLFFPAGKRISELEQFPELWCGLKLSKVLSHLLSLLAGEQKMLLFPLSAKNPLKSPAGTQWFGVLSREGYSSFSGCKEEGKGLGESQKVFSRDCFQQLLSFLVNTYCLNPLKFSKEGEEFTQKKGVFTWLKPQGPSQKSTCCCFLTTSCTSQSQTKGTGTIRKKSALHGCHHGRAMAILSKAPPHVLCAKGNV